MAAATAHAIVATVAHIITIVASILQLRMWLSLLLLQLRRLLVILIIWMWYIRMMQLISIWGRCTVRHRHCHRWWRWMGFVLQRLKMIDLSINSWFLKVIVCWRLIWQRIFCVCILNFIIPCWCSRCYGCCWYGCRRRYLLTTRWYAAAGRIISRYCQLSIM